jgi:hypothetical protein
MQEDYVIRRKARISPCKLYSAMGLTLLFGSLVTVVLKYLDMIEIDSD